MSDDKVKTLEVKRSARLSGFYQQTPERRRARLVEARWQGVQKGHMSLHARRVAAEAGASGELVGLIAERLSSERVYRPERARELLADEVAQRKGARR